MAIDITQLGRKKDDIKLDGVAQVMADHAEEFIKRVKANLAKDGSNATRALSQSIAPEIKVFGFKYQLVISAEEYWEVVDKGRKAGKFPPYSSTPFSVNGIAFDSGFPDLIKWIMAKPLRVNQSTMPKKGPTPAWRRNSVKGLAYVIARKKKRERQPGTRFMSRELKPFLKKIENDLTIALRRDVELHLQTTITKQAPGR
jgi:hypothetical protein